MLKENQLINAARTNQRTIETVENRKLLEKID